MIQLEKMRAAIIMDQELILVGVGIMIGDDVEYTLAISAI